jgi:hypothetical protein
MFTGPIEKEKYSMAYNIHMNFPCYGNEVLGSIIHNRLIELGYTPQSSCTRSLATAHAFCLIPEHKQYHYNSWATDGDGEGSLNDLFFTDKYKIKKPIQVKLNNEYTAEVTDVVKVGCQEFSANAINELAEALKKYKE